MDISDVKTYLYNIFLHFYKNYKWICVILLCLFILNSYKLNIQYILSIISFSYIMGYAHIIHYAGHITALYPINILHVYHHSVSNTLFSDFLEILFEIITLFFPIIFKGIAQYYCNIDFYVINVWSHLLFIFSYLTIHKINYSIFRVNNIHKIHHEKLLKNFGPDIIDTIFFTKDNPATDIENMDHTIINLIVSLIIVLFIKYGYEKNILTTFLFIVLYSSLFIISVAAGFAIYIDNINYNFKKELEKFKSDFNNINYVEKICNSNNITIYEYIKKLINDNIYHHKSYLLYK